jgi:hypothetical protein
VLVVRGDVGEGEGTTGRVGEILFEADLIVEGEGCPGRGEEGVLAEVVLPALAVQVLLTIKRLLDALPLDVPLLDLVNTMQHLFHS